MINSSLDGNEIIVKDNIHIGIATALPSGNLIVPVVRNSDQKDLKTLAKDVNGLVAKARDNKLTSEETKGSTFTISNVGIFRKFDGNSNYQSAGSSDFSNGNYQKTG